MADTYAYLTVKQYAGLCGVTLNAVYTAIRRGTLPYLVDRPLSPKGGIQIRVPLEVVKRYRGAA